MPEGTAAAARVSAGLCASCRHARRIENDRGSTFVLCGHAAVDSRYPKYPHLPVRACAAYEPVPERDPDSAHSQAVRGSS